MCECGGKSVTLCTMSAAASDAGAAVSATAVLEASDVPYEEDIIRNPFSVCHYSAPLALLFHAPHVQLCPSMC